MTVPSIEPSRALSGPPDTDATADAALSCGLVGAGGHARVVVEALQRSGGHIEALFVPLDEDAPTWSQAFAVRHDLDQAAASGLPLHLAIGDNETRRRLAAETAGARWLSIIDPRAMTPADLMLGEGSLIVMGAMVQAGARIGRHAIINTGAVVEHDVTVGDFAHVAPGSRLLGGVTVGEGALIGAGAVVLPGLQIGAWAVIGAGAVVTRSVPAGGRVVGVPARALPGTDQ